MTVDSSPKHTMIVLLSIAATLSVCMGSDDANLKDSPSSQIPCVGGLEPGIAAGCIDGARASSDDVFTFAPESVMFDDDELAALVYELDNAVQHLILDLRHTKVGDRGLQALAQHLPASLQGLAIDLEGTEVTDLGVEALAAALPTSLQCLQADTMCTSMGDTGLEALARKLPRDLKTLHLGVAFRSVGDRGVEALAKELPRSLQTLRLDIFHTSMSDRGLEALAREIPGSVQALHLGMKDSRVRETGLVALGKGLPGSLRSLYIDIDTADVNDVGVESLGQGLPSSLKRLVFLLAYTAVGGLGLEGFSRGLPGGLQSLTIGAWVSGVNDTGLQGLARSLPSGLQHLHVDFSYCQVTDKGVEALAAYRGAHLESMHVDFHTTVVGDRSLRALCAMDVMHRKGMKKIRLGATFVSAPEAKDCQARVPDVDLVYDSSPTPWPKAIDDLIYGDGTVTHAVSFHGRCDGGLCTINHTFDCREQEWILIRDAIGRTVYQKASARHGSESLLAKCLEAAGGNPSSMQQIARTLSCGWTWLTVAGATCCGLVLARVRVRADSLATGQQQTDGIRISMWLRMIEVAAQCVMFFGPVALALTRPISFVVFSAGVVLPACSQHGLNHVLKYPVLVFASRTPLGFAISGLRCALLACIAWEFTTHAHMYSSLTSRLADTQDIKIETRVLVQDFDDIDVLGISAIKHETWEEMANPFLARFEYNRSWVSQSISLPVPHTPSFDVSVKMMFDAWVHLLIVIGCMWACAVIVLLVRHFATPGPEPSALCGEGKGPLVKTPDDEAEGGDLLDRAKDTWQRFSKAKVVAFFLLDFATDANTIIAMLFSDNFKFAFVLMTVWIASVVEECMYGVVLDLREETEQTLRTGRISRRVQGIVEREASFDTCFSAAVTAYAFPFVVSSVYSMLSLTFSLFTACLTMANFLYYHLDADKDSIEHEEVDAE